MKVRLVTSLREFDALGPLWRDVIREGGQGSPFLSHDWFACCWRTAGPNRGREVWIVEDAAGPLGLLPLTRWRARIRGLPVRMLGFLESPDTPFVEVPVARDADAVVAGFLNALAVRSDWDVLMLPKLRAGSKSRQALEAALSGWSRWSITGTERAPYLRISGSWESFLREKTQRFRKTCRNIENRLRYRGEVTIEEHREVDVEGPVFEELLQVSGQSWKAPRGVAMATMLGMPRFFRELTRRASVNGWLHVWILRLDGRALATEYQIGADGSLHALRADYDESQADLSPGAGLNLQIVRSLFEGGSVQEYDMGPGANGYKLRWATGSHELVGIRAYAPTAYGRLLHTIENRLVPIARQVRSRIRALCA